MRRRIERLERDNAILHQLVSQIRDASNTQVQQILSLIRSNAPLVEVNDLILQVRQNAVSDQRQVNPVVDNMYQTLQRIQPDSRPKLPSSESSSSSEPASRVLTVTRLIDEPLYRVPAAPWTSVVQDEHLVSHLVSLWATWHHLLPDGIILEPFLRAMKAARLESHFCSPFLVNCVLAVGCLYSDYDEAKTVQGRASDLMARFVQEAESHLKQDRSTPSITKVQGLGILYIIISQLYRDRDGYQYAVQAAIMSEELLRARERIVASIEDKEGKQELAFALDTACWGVFSATSASMSAWMRRQLVDPPEQPCSEAGKVNASFHASAWSPYPRSGAVPIIHLDECLRHHYKLAVMTAELTHELYSDRESRSSPARREVLHDLHVRFIFWYARLPEYMKQEVPGCPSTTMLLIWYHGIVLILLEAKIKVQQHSQEEDEEGEGKAVSTDHTDEEADSDPESGARAAAFRGADLIVGSSTDEEHLVHQARRIAGLFTSVRNTHDYSRLHCFLCQPCLLALYVLVKRNADHRYDAEVTEFFTAMRAMGRRFPFTFSMLRMTQVDLLKRKLDLPVPTEKLFEEYKKVEDAAWRQKGTFNSIYPSPQLFAGPYADEATESGRPQSPADMMEFLQIFDGLKIG